MVFYQRPKLSYIVLRMKHILLHSQTRCPDHLFNTFSLVPCTVRARSLGAVHRGRRSTTCPNGAGPFWALPTKRSSHWTVGTYRPRDRETETSEPETWSLHQGPHQTKQKQGFHIQKPCFLLGTTRFLMGRVGPLAVCIFRTWDMT